MPLRPSMQWITLEVIMRLVVGARERERRDRLRSVLVALLEGTDLLLLTMLGGRNFGPWRPAQRFVRVRNAVDEALYEEIRERRADPGDDILSMLIAARDEHGNAMTDQELRDELVTLLLAGHETTATGLAWAAERLVREPRALSELRSSVEAGEDDYLDATVKEVLRVRPVIMDVGRRLKEPAEVAGHALPAGVIVVLAILLVHEDPQHYPEPLAFRPERFLEGQPEPYTWIPFGGGRRRCLGASFATLEMKVVLRTLLERVALEAVSPRPERQKPRNVTLVPARGARVRLTEVRA